ncbi:PKD domain-containing protein [Streptosporangium lutulentum]
MAFSSAGSSDPDGDALTYSWAFGDGGTSTAANPTHVYTTDGRRTVTLTVRDGTGLTATANVEINVGNTAPTVSIQLRSTARCSPSGTPCRTGSPSPTPRTP